jgi:hypothetical protein
MIRIRIKNKTHQKRLKPIITTHKATNKHKKQSTKLHTFTTMWNYRNNPKFILKNNQKNSHKTTKRKL